MTCTLLRHCNTHTDTHTHRYRAHDFTFSSRKLFSPTFYFYDLFGKMLCAKANSAFYPQREGKWILLSAECGLRNVLAYWGWYGRWYVSILHRQSNCPLTREWHKVCLILVLSVDGMSHDRAHRRGGLLLNVNNARSFSCLRPLSP